MKMEDEGLNTPPDSTLNELFDTWTVLKAEKNDLEQKLDQVDEKLNPLEAQIIELMTALNYQKIQHNDVLHWLSVVARPLVKPDKRAQFIHEYLEPNHEDGIVQRDYINSNTLWGWYNQQPDEVKEILTQYLEAPEKIYLNSPKDYVRKRKKR